MDGLVRQMSSDVGTTHCQHAKVTVSLLRWGPVYDMTRHVLLRVSKGIGEVHDNDRLYGYT